MFTNVKRILTKLLLLTIIVFLSIINIVYKIIYNFIIKNKFNFKKIYNYLNRLTVSFKRLYAEVN